MISKYFTRSAVLVVSLFTTNSAVAADSTDSAFCVEVKKCTCECVGDTIVSPEECFYEETRTIKKEFHVCESKDCERLGGTKSTGDFPIVCVVRLNGSSSEVRAQGTAHGMECLLVNCS